MCHRFVRWDLLVYVSQACLYWCYLDDCFSNDAKQFFMLYLTAHASTHLPIDTALKDMVIELLLDVAAIELFSL